MNKIDQHKTQICTNPVKRQWRKTMKKTLPTMMLSAAIAAASFSLPTHAAVIDQVKDKVNAIKNDTNTLKSKATDNQNRLSELSMTANAQIAEQIDIRGLLEPLVILKDMKTKFSGGGIDPAELMDGIDTQEIKVKLDEMKQNRAEIQAMISDPGLEDFRLEFLEMLSGLNLIFADEGLIEVSPMETMIEKAPLPLIAALKVASETSFGPLRDSVVSALESLDEMRSMGLLEVADNGAGYNDSGFVPASFVQSASFGDNADELSAAIESYGISKVYSVLVKYQGKLLKIKQGKGKVNKKVMKILRKIPKFPDLGIHGYLTIKLSGVDLPKHYSELSTEQKSALQDAIDRNSLKLRKLEWRQINANGSCSSGSFVKDHRENVSSVTTENEPV
jgi:hypothetical protein